MDSDTQFKPVINPSFNPVTLNHTADVGSPRGNSIVLIGFMGAGKSLVGRACADRLGLEFVDLDELIESRARITVAEIFAIRGETEFRKLEREALVIAAARTGVVIASGGGAPMDPVNAAMLRSAGTVVHLSVRPETVLERIGTAPSRPLLAGSLEPLKAMTELLFARRKVYVEVSDVTVSTDSRSPGSIAREIIALTSAGLPANGIKNTTKRIQNDAGQVFHAERLLVNTRQRSYSIWLAQNILNCAGPIIGEFAGKTNACVVTHPHLIERYAVPLIKSMNTQGMRCTVVAIAPGESRKNLRTVERLYREFLSAKLDRKGLVVALGGGVIGDITGFAAACYLRGIAYVQAPTTLLAQVDSSVGGKTGVDLPEGKNLVGAFYQPSLVLIDPATLRTLPARELRSGLAEVIKYGIISDERFFYQTRDELSALLQRKPQALMNAISRSCEIKAGVVGEDETEQGIRAILNFGHTVGHALESVTQYKQFKHGEAIAIGMVSASLVGEELGITPPSVTKEIKECLRAAGLPIAFPPTQQFEPIHFAMLLDKKTQSGKLRFVIAEAIGRVKLVDDVSPNVVKRAIERQKPS